MIKIEGGLRPHDLMPAVERLFEFAADKISSLHRSWDPGQGSPVFTRAGRYASRSWTDWTLGFYVGLALLEFDATGDPAFLELGRSKTIALMPPHVSAMGVHDHGFNNVSTYGVLRRLMLEGRIAHDQRELELYELALKVSGAVQAARYASTETGKGYIYSFNGSHSLFADTMRSLRSLALAHRLGQRLMGEADQPIDLLGRALEHAETTARYNVYYGEGRDIYDVRGRVAHESIFNPRNGQYRCPSSQQGYSPYTTWTRGAAWIILGYAEQLELLADLADGELDAYGGRATVESVCLRAARATSDYYIDGYACLDGIPYWDTGAPGLGHMPDCLAAPAAPYNAHEPVDSSAAAIAAQGFVRLGRCLIARGEISAGERYLAAGLTVARTLLDEPYLSAAPGHQGLLLHSVYHRPNGWDHIPPGCQVPCGESSMWGDYHLLELALLIQRLEEGSYFKFF
jgi:unsaturated chondroitin disaccharide hydrolase